MQRRFLKFIFGTIIIGTAIIIALSGCSLYEAIDNRLHSKPEIEENAVFQIDRHTNGTSEINFTIFVSDGDMAMFYYLCRNENEWDSDRVVGSQEVNDGEARDFHRTMCETQLMVQVVVYNNYRKRSQRHSSMAWVINIQDHKQLQAQR